MATPTLYIDAPVATPAKGGLLAVASILTSERGSAVHYQPDACGPALVDIDRCNPPTNISSVAVTSAGVATVTVAEAPEDEALTIDWGDDTTDSTVTKNNANPAVGPVSSSGHAYAAPGHYVITVTGATFGTQTIPVTVTDGLASTNDSTNKVYDGIELITGAPFTVYKGIACDLLTSSDTQVRAERALELGEGRAVETVVWDTLLATPNAVDLTPTPGTAVSVKYGLGLLERYAGEAYGAVPTIHASRVVIPFLADLGSSDGTLTSQQGSLIANGSGYTANTGPDGEVAGAGEQWMYVTGQVILSRTSVISNHVNGLELNDALAVAERIYSASVECFVAAVLVTLEGN